MVSFSEGGTGIGVLAPDYMAKKAKRGPAGLGATHRRKHKKSHCPPSLSHGATGKGVLAPKKRKVHFANPWMTALKKWNKGGSWCIPRKGSSDYAAVRKMM